jgi:curved DNA-binding protein CbpA
MPYTDEHIRENPWTVLDVSMEADDDQIRAAYLEKVKAFPPDRCGDQFQKIRDAYAQLKDHYQRSKWLILGSSSEAPLESLLAESPQQRRYLGPEPWLTMVKHKRKGQ